jgi:hypothetical protein
MFQGRTFVGGKHEDPFDFLQRADAVADLPVPVVPEFVGNVTEEGSAKLPDTDIGPDPP